MKLWSKYTSPENQEITSKAPETKKSYVLKSAMVATALLSTQVQASDLIAQCDLNHNWIIDTRLTYKQDWVPKYIAKKEVKCSTKFELQREQVNWKQLDKDIKWLDKDIKWLEWKILAKKR